jgi:hypothetical protein
VDRFFLVSVTPILVRERIKATVMSVSVFTVRVLCSIAVFVALLPRPNCSSRNTVVANRNRIVFPSSDPNSATRSLNRQPSVRSDSVTDYIDTARDANITDVRQFLGAFGLDMNQLEDPVMARRNSPDIPMQANCQIEMRTIDLDQGKARALNDADVSAYVNLSSQIVRLERRTFRWS